jgi:predicted nucleic acid-binding protein
VRNVLIDAGPLIALFAVDDAHHARYDQLVSQASPGTLRLVTTWPCVVEAAYLLRAKLRFEMLDWIGRGAVQVYPFDTAHLMVMVPWMRRYGTSTRREMDLADASLIWLAHETGLREIMTTDVNDFTRYRLPDGGALKLL